MRRSGAVEERKKTHRLRQVLCYRIRTRSRSWRKRRSRAVARGGRSSGDSPPRRPPGFIAHRPFVPDRPDPPRNSQVPIQSGIGTHIRDAISKGPIGAERGNLQLPGDYYPINRRPAALPGSLGSFPSSRQIVTDAAVRAGDQGAGGVRWHNGKPAAAIGRAGGTTISPKADYWLPVDWGFFSAGSVWR